MGEPKGLVNRLRWWLWDDAPDWFPDRLVLRLLCLVTGHTPDRDMCNDPEHDYCVVCFKSMPHAAGSGSSQAQP